MVMNIENMDANYTMLCELFKLDEELAKVIVSSLSIQDYYRNLLRKPFGVTKRNLIFLLLTKRVVRNDDRQPDIFCGKVVIPLLERWSFKTDN